MGGGHGHGHGGGGGGFHPHGPSRGIQLAADVLATSFWLFILISAKERGPYTFVRAGRVVRGAGGGRGEWMGAVRRGRGREGGGEVWRGAASVRRA
jgi:hypothetical protein